VVSTILFILGIGIYILLGIHLALPYLYTNYTKNNEVLVAEAYQDWKLQHKNISNSFERFIYSDNFPFTAFNLRYRILVWIIGWPLFVLVVATKQGYTWLVSELSFMWRK